MTAEADVNAEITATKGDKNMFQRVKERFSGRKNKKKIQDQTAANDRNSMESVSLSEKELQGIEEKSLIESSDEKGKKTKTIEKVKDLLKSSGQNGTLQADANEEKHKQKVSTLQRVKERMSIRNGKKHSPTNDQVEDEQSEVTNAKIGNNVDGSQEKIDNKEQEVLEDQDVTKEKKSTTLMRVKERFSSRNNEKSKEKNRSSSDVKKSDADNSGEVTTKERETNMNTETGEARSQTFIQRLLSLFRRKKNNAEEADSLDDDLEKSEKDLSEEDREVLEICGADNESDEKCSTVPKITTTKPPLPGM